MTLPQKSAPARRAGFEESCPSFCNLAITGKPVIPQEVRMSDGNGLRVWQSHFFGETQHAFAAGRTVNPATIQVAWSLADGVITAPKRAADSPKSQSILRNQRPLLAGESISYEFKYLKGNDVLVSGTGAIGVSDQIRRCEGSLADRWNQRVDGVPERQCSVGVALPPRPTSVAIERGRLEQSHARTSGWQSNVHTEYGEVAFQ